ncbi:hypothetical protein U9M48_022422 [Paspalum notatum var. saurae]|uniref:Uncharacterized protein n=1 Tax=Paspalum notatum var. saurae TaxID=547442 RepID=A0AAQ3TM07_PASNO
MAAYPGSSSLAKYWRMEEEEDDDFTAMVDDDDELVLELVSKEEAEGSRRRGARRPKEIRSRDHGSGDKRIHLDYFCEKPVYNDFQFRRRFRMRRHVVERLINAVEAVDPYFKYKEDALHQTPLTGLQKVVASLRILAYGLPSDAVDEYVRIGQSTARQALQHFCAAVIKAFGPYYLRAPNANDVASLLQTGEDRGFPGMIGSIDCMHWEWKNCPTSWRGQFTGRGSCNDINVLHRSPVFSAYLQGQATPVSFAVNENTYNMGYYLADGIYPEWPSFVKTVRHPMDAKTKHFAKCQEGARKDIERAFGVLQARWAVLRGPAYGWDRANLSDIMKACIIMHNMIVEDEGPSARNTNFEGIGELAVPYRSSQERRDYIEAHHTLRNKTLHQQLQYNLIEHQWARLGSNAE